MSRKQLRQRTLSWIPYLFQAQTKKLTSCPTAHSEMHGPGPQPIPLNRDASLAATGQPHLRATVSYRIGCFPPFTNARTGDASWLCSNPKSGTDDVDYGAAEPELQIDALSFS